MTRRYGCPSFVFVLPPPKQNFLLWSPGSPESYLLPPGGRLDFKDATRKQIRMLFTFPLHFFYYSQNYSRFTIASITP